METITGSWGDQVCAEFFYIEDVYGVIVSRHTKLVEACREFMRLGRPAGAYVTMGRYIGSTLSTRHVMDRKGRIF